MPHGMTEKKWCSDEDTAYDVSILMGGGAGRWTEFYNFLWLKFWNLYIASQHFTSNFTSLITFFINPMLCHRSHSTFGWLSNRKWLPTETCIFDGVLIQVSRRVSVAEHWSLSHLAHLYASLLLFSLRVVSKPFVAHQAPLAIGFPRHPYCPQYSYTRVGCHFPLQGSRVLS